MNVELLIWVGSISCLFGIGAEARQLRSCAKQSAFITSPFVLPLYFAGIMQWFLFGLYSSRPALLIGCGLQIVVLTTCIRPFIEYQRSES